jgi:hypothetical protein
MKVVNHAAVCGARACDAGRRRVEELFQAHDNMDKASPVWRAVQGVPACAKENRPPERWPIVE